MLPRQYAYIPPPTPQLQPQQVLSFAQQGPSRQITQMQMQAQAQQTRTPHGLRQGAQATQRLMPPPPTPVHARTSQGVHIPQFRPSGTGNAQATTEGTTNQGILFAFEVRGVASVYAQQIDPRGMFLSLPRSQFRIRNSSNNRTYLDSGTATCAMWLRRRSPLPLHSRLHLKDKVEIEVRGSHSHNKP